MPSFADWSCPEMLTRSLVGRAAWATRSPEGRPTHIGRAPACMRGVADLAVIPPDEGRETTAEPAVGQDGAASFHVRYAGFLAAATRPAFPGTGFVRCMGDGSVPALTAVAGGATRRVATNTPAIAAAPARKAGVRYYIAHIRPLFGA